MLSRRNFLGVATFTTAAIGLAPRQVFADPENPVITFHKDAGKAKISITRLRGNISVLEGSGGNIAVLTGPDGKLLVDAGLSESRRQLSEALASISRDPVKHLINSHWHFDHTDGNEWLHGEGATITAHENTRKHMSVNTRMEIFNFTFPAAPAGALPATVFSEEHKLEFNGVTLVLKKYPSAHTDSDISIEFTDADILHVGDTWLNGHFPLIDYSTGGSINGTIQATELNVNRVSEKTIVIPGHGPIGNKADLIEYRDMLVAVRDKVAALKKRGLSLNEVIVAAPTAAFDKKWGTWLIDGKTFTSLVYAGV
ncbi:MAG: MBL fold metallo-hydrolase [Nitrospiraceae bacterium]|nr:MBL fold metallo-hydrolase [Nitrospiraceae bacterium]